MKILHTVLATPKPIAARVDHIDVRLAGAEVQAYIDLIGKASRVSLQTSSRYGPDNHISDDQARTLQDMYTKLVDATK